MLSNELTPFGWRASHRHRCRAVASTTSPLPLLALLLLLPAHDASALQIAQSSTGYGMLAISSIVSNGIRMSLRSCGG